MTNAALQEVMDQTKAVMDEVQLRLNREGKYRSLCDWMLEYFESNKLQGIFSVLGEGQAIKEQIIHWRNDFNQIMVNK